MKCPACGHVKSHVLSTRDGRRRRECTACKHRFTTLEVVQGRQLSRAWERAFQEARNAQ